MSIAAGELAYTVEAPPLDVAGLILKDEEMRTALRDRLMSILDDSEGEQVLRSILEPLAETQFQTENLNQLLSATRQVPDWRVGEALAEAYLSDHCSCQFPWPGGRDLKNPASSPAGTDLVGFQNDGMNIRFAFGEVKTSEESKWPPSVVKGRHGLKEQIGDLRDRKTVRDSLVLYLGHHAANAAWQESYRHAARRYLSDSTDVALFGLLVRDVSPNDLDLRAKAKALATNCPCKTSIVLKSIYLPNGCIKELPQAVANLRVVSNP